MASETEIIPISFNKIMQSKAYTVIVLDTGEKKFAIYTEPSVGQNIQKHLIDGKKNRPYTHNLLNSILKGLNVKLLQVVINDIEDTVYFARLFLEQELGETKQILEIDARPSDCVMLALLNNLPIYCKKAVADKAVAIEE
jgi:hypothetical protein